MMERVVTLTDGPHKLRTPSHYALDLMDGDGVHFIGVTDEKREAMAAMPPMRYLAVVLAAMLTEAEPVDAAGEPAKHWTYPEVLRLLPLDAEETGKVDAQTGELLSDALTTLYPQTGEGDTLPPTKARSRGGRKP